MNKILMKLLCISNPEDSEEDINVLVTFNSYHYPGRNYMSNGDPGYPDDSGMDIVEWVIHNRQEKKPNWLTDDLVQQEFDNSKNW